MADVSVSGLPENTNPSSSDYGITDDGTTTKKSTWQNIVKAIGPILYPIGSYYINETDNTNPATLFGFGTWVAVTDKMIMAAGSTYTAGDTGGAATHTHTLTNAYAMINIGAVSNTALTYRRKSGVANFYNTHGSTNVNGGGNTDLSTSGAEVGGSTDSTSNLPPYITAYVWKRTA